MLVGICFFHIIMCMGLEEVVNHDARSRPLGVRLYCTRMGLSQV